MFFRSRRTTVLGSLFNRVADLMTCNFIKKRPQNRCFSVKFAKFLRTPILKNISKRLLLVFLSCFCYFETFYFQVFFQQNLNWNSEWFVTAFVNLRYIVYFSKIQKNTRKICSLWWIKWAFQKSKTKNLCIMIKLIWTKNSRNI